MRKITLENINSVIKKEFYYIASEGLQSSVEDVPEGLTRMTLCFLELKNGYIVQGVSCCADQATFSKELGEKYAKEQAIEKIWPLLGYELRTELSQESSNG